MTVRVTSAGTECVRIRCAQDKHIPKTYSYENNMHTGTVPQDLTVSLKLTQKCLATTPRLH